jgi:hypothetical protein
MPPIPEELMARLRQANEHLTQAKQKLDSAEMFNTDESRAAAAALRQAEAELEQVTREIDGYLPPEAASAAPPPGAGFTA